MYLFPWVFSGYICLGVEKLDDVVFQFVCFEETLCCLHSGSPNCHSHQQCMGLPYSPPPCEDFLFGACWMLATVTGVRWYVMAVWICISLTISDVEHLFRCLIAICLSSSEKEVYSDVLPIFRLGCWLVGWLVGFSPTELYELFIHLDSPLLSHFTCRYCVPFLGCLFVLLMVSFAVRKLWSSTRSRVFRFA